MAALSLRDRALLYYGCGMPNHPRKWWLHNYLRRILRVQVQEQQEVVRAGLRWLLDPTDYGHADLFWLGKKDTWVIQALRGVVHPGDVIIEAGANFGYFALSLAAHLRGRCHVHACEPCPANRDLLEKNIALNGLEGLVQTHGVAFSKSPGQSELIESPGNSGHARFRRVDHGAFPIITLDDFCQEQSLEQLNLLILDVEGYELQLLVGGAAALSRFKPVVVVELWRPVMALENSTPELVVDLLQKQGYRLYESVRGRLQPLTALPSGDRGIYAFAFPDGSSPTIAR
jgi:FkbM family methyltransferase